MYDARVAQQLSIITLGHVHAEELAALTTRFERLEQLVLDVAPDAELSSHRAEFNRAVDAATNDWILIVRERERVPEALAAEILDGVTAAKVRGFRIRTTVLYLGKPLRLGDEAGELRLFHRRSYMRYAEKGQWEHLLIQGTVVRMAQSFEAASFATAAEHRAQLARTGVPHSALRHVLLFVRYAIGSRTLDRTTLRYLWIEAGFDKA
jgi:hypothetical protein